MRLRGLLSAREEAKVRSLQEQTKSAERLNGLLRKIEARTIKVALTAPDVAERLKERRHEVVGVDLPVLEGAVASKRTPSDEKRGMAEIGIYDYDNNVLVVSSVDLRKGTVTKIEERRGFQPSLTPREEEEAKKIIFADARYRNISRQARLQVVAYPVRAVFLESHAYYSHRCFVLYFWTVGKGSRKIGRAVVDLSTRQLVPVEEVRMLFDQGDEL